MTKLTDEQKKVIKELIGFCVHKGLRWCESKESNIAWKSISDLPDEDWDSAVGYAQEEMVKYIENDFKIKNE